MNHQLVFDHEDIRAMHWQAFPSDVPFQVHLWMYQLLPIYQANRQRVKDFLETSQNEDAWAEAFAMQVKLNEDLLECYRQAYNGDTTVIDRYIGLVELAGEYPSTWVTYST